MSDKLGLKKEYKKESISDRDFKILFEGIAKCGEVHPNNRQATPSDENPYITGDLDLLWLYAFLEKLVTGEGSKRNTINFSDFKNLVNSSAEKLWTKFEKGRYRNVNADAVEIAISAAAQISNTKLLKAIALILEECKLEIPIVREYPEIKNNLLAEVDNKPKSKKSKGVAGQEAHNRNISEKLTEAQFAIFLKIVRKLPDSLQTVLLEKIQNQELQITELQATVGKLERALDSFASDDNITDEIRLLVEAGKIDEAEKKVDKIVSTRVKEERQKQNKKHGQYFYQQGKIKHIKLNYKDAYKAFKEAVKCQPKNGGFLNSAGVLCLILAKYRKAARYFEKALKLNINELGEEHPDTIASYENVAINLHAQGRYDEAEPLLRKGLEILQHVLGEDHPDIAHSYDNMATNLKAQGKYDKAEPLYLKGLEIRQHVLGEEHPDTAASYNNVAHNLNLQGKYDEAEHIFRKGLEIQQRVLGEEHPHTAVSYNNMALNLNAQGKFDEAEPLYRKGLEIRQRVLGEEHPGTATSYNDMALNLNAKGKFDEAESLLRKGLEIRQRVLGEDHPHTAVSYNNVALNLNAQGKYDEAERLYRKSYEILLNLLGKNHPTTIEVWNNWQRK